MRLAPLAGLCVLLASAPALAERERVAILPLVIEGDAPPELRYELQRSVSEGLGAAGWSVVPHATVEQTLRSAPELSGCVSTACLARLGERLSARRFVRARVEATGAAYALELDLLTPGAEGVATTRVEGSCPVCTIVEAKDMARETASGLKGKAAAAPAPETEAPAPALPTTAPASASAPERRSLAPWAWGATGLAAATLTTGIVLLSLDGNCTSDGPAGTTCPTLYDTAVGGALLAAAGFGLGAGAGYLFWRDHHEQARPQIAILPGGRALVGVGLSF